METTKVELDKRVQIVRHSLRTNSGYYEEWFEVRIDDKPVGSRQRIEEAFKLVVVHFSDEVA